MCARVFAAEGFARGISSRSSFGTTGCAAVPDGECALAACAGTAKNDHDRLVEARSLTGAAEHPPRGGPCRIDAC